MDLIGSSNRDRHNRCGGRCRAAPTESGRAVCRTTRPRFHARASVGHVGKCRRVPTVDDAPRRLSRRTTEPALMQPVGMPDNTRATYGRGPGHGPSSYGATLPSLRYWRTRLGLRQTELAAMARVSIATVQRVEAGGGARLSTARRLAGVLEVSLARLMAPAPDQV